MKNNILIVENKDMKFGSPSPSEKLYINKPTEKTTNMVLEELLNTLNNLKIESTKPNSRRTGDYRIGLTRAMDEISSLIK